MKKNVWLLGVAVAALTSCTQNEVLEVPEGKQIRFEEFVEKNSRSATEEIDKDITQRLLTNYWVYGYYTTAVTKTGEGTQGSPYVYTGDFTGSKKKTVFEGMAMSRSNENDPWNYGKKDNWVSKALYRFAAYTNGNQEITSGVSYDPEDDCLSFENYAVVDSAELKSSNTLKALDLVASIPGDRYSDNQNEVNFTFRHLLSKVTFHFSNKSNKADLVFKNIQVKNISKEGDCSCYFPGTTMSNAKVAGVFPKNVIWNKLGTAGAFNYGTVAILNGGNSTSTASVTLYLIPQSNETVQVTMTMEEVMANSQGVKEVYNTEELTFNLNTNTHYTSAVDDVATNMWVPGYHYRYLISKGTGFNDIQFTAAVSEWNKNRNGDTEKGDDNDNVDLTPAPTPNP